MNWRKFLHPNQKKSTGRSTDSETRLSVEFLLGLFAAGWTQQQVLEKYPALTAEKLRAALAKVDPQLVSVIASPELLEILAEVIKQEEEEKRTMQ